MVLEVTCDVIKTISNCRFKDGAPLPNSNRFKLTNDFGFVALDIAHTVDNDSGTYTVVASNEKGESFSRLKN